MGQRVADSLNRKSSVFRQNLSGLEQRKLTAHELLPKLKLLYKIGMASFWHHLDQKNFRAKAVISKTASSKAGNDITLMKFPQNLGSWDVHAELADNVEDPADATNRKISTASNGRDSSRKSLQSGNSGTNYLSKQHSGTRDAGRERRGRRESQRNDERL